MSFSLHTRRESSETQKESLSHCYNQGEKSLEKTGWDFLYCVIVNNKGKTKRSAITGLVAKYGMICGLK
jgi:hypothetical protein